eukprot:CAMPEP_0115292986 /NCGR_PEP_ID=MMETSP0270-20121206/65425_1 /TAXON_ID=71861 /ORGANISM="Scrippsiella trochoidea, Strain CCMP3099" /LENGTH=45 /DNA_ID= /DNA_START= /DNA_END= /DNA_ORIENTATION=
MHRGTGRRPNAIGANQNIPVDGLAVIQSGDDTSLLGRMLIGDDAS